MKKILTLLLVSLAVISTVEAKDYAKMHMKEMKKMQKYSATKNYFENSTVSVKKNVNLEIKDPKLIKLGTYEEVPMAKYKQKEALDEAEYKKIETFLMSRKVDNYNKQAYSEDFYKIYRIAEKLIRANNLDFINWRIVIDVESSFNAYMSDTNCITINTGLIDTFLNNEDAMAFIIGHEMAHSLLGHRAKKSEYIEKLNRISKVASYEVYTLQLRKYMSAARKMELQADAEGARLMARAGYNLDMGREAISFMNTMGNASDVYNTHPKPRIRLENFDDNRKYFVEDEFVKLGRYNIYNSKVLRCEKSSDRKSITIARGQLKDASSYFSIETPEQMLLRFGYASYLNEEFKDAIDYFEKYLKENESDYVTNLYISYAYEALYKKTSNKKYIDLAREYAKTAQTLAPHNKYIEEQLLSL